jgi:hypothetical protein
MSELGPRHQAFSAFSWVPCPQLGALAPRARAARSLLALAASGAAASSYITAELGPSDSEGLLWVPGQLTLRNVCTLQRTACRPAATALGGPCGTWICCCCCQAACCAWVCCCCCYCPVSAERDWRAMQRAHLVRGCVDRRLQLGISQTAQIQGCARHKP